MRVRKNQSNLKRYTRWTARESVHAMVLCVGLTKQGILSVTSTLLHSTEKVSTSNIKSRNDVANNAINISYIIIASTLLKMPFWSNISRSSLNPNIVSESVKLFLNQNSYLEKVCSAARCKVFAKRTRSIQFVISWRGRFPIIWHC